MKFIKFCIPMLLQLTAVVSLAQPNKIIPIETKDFALVLYEDNSKKLLHTYFGKKFNNKADYKKIADQYRYESDWKSIANNAYTPSGTWSLIEPALQVIHADGNLSTDLIVEKVETKVFDAGKIVAITLKDSLYKLQVILHFKVYENENLIEQWAEITNKEAGNIVLNKYASANLFFDKSDFYLTTFQGDYLRELQPIEEKLLQGSKVIETKLGTRAMLFNSPNFLISFDKPASENEGLVVLGQLAWTGNYKMEFEIDSRKNLRLIAGINPFSSAYTLAPGKTFKTPVLIYTMSESGVGGASRQMQHWARKYKLLNGEGDRLTMLNNWEVTHFNFDEKKIALLMGDAKKLGVDLFLLDDGWFGNKYPRDNDLAGLGDWQENKKKLPSGIGYLVQEAKKNGTQFGIWLEPEMINPKSELFEKHPEWVLRQPQRPDKYYRNQLVLDLSNPKVQDFTFNMLDELFTKNPELAFIKWDCNAVIYNAYSSYAHDNKIPATHVYVDYVTGLYNVLERIKKKYPKLQMMLCSGGGARADYEILKYFTEFWPSDNTSAIDRIFLQWNYSYFFPAIATCCHVTNWGNEPIKLKVDVASMGKLGFDIDVSHLSEKDLAFCQQAVKNYKQYKPTILHGNQYRLINPYKGPAASFLYVNDSKAEAVMFTYVHTNRMESILFQSPVKLQGLDPEALYTVKEINVYPGGTPAFDGSQEFSGEFLMKVGINIGMLYTKASRVLVLNRKK